MRRDTDMILTREKNWLSKDFGPLTRIWRRKCVDLIDWL